LHTAQLMPLPPTVSSFSKIQIGFTFLVPAHPGSPGQRAAKRVCVCVLSGTTRVDRYEKKHSPTHTHPGHQTSFINFLYCEPNHSPCSIYMLLLGMTAVDRLLTIDETFDNVCLVFLAFVHTTTRFVAIIQVNLH